MTLVPTSLDQQVSMPVEQNHPGGHYLPLFPTYSNTRLDAGLYLGLGSYIMAQDVRLASSWGMGLERV